MKYKESRRDAERDDRYGEKQRESRESRRDPERDDRYAERERESKEHRKDAERDDRYGERERESKEHRRDAERDDRYNEKERENKERRRDLERDDRYSERERENKESRKDVDHHRSKGARESATRAREDKEHSSKDERDLKFRGEKDSIRKDGKHSSSTEKHKAKEERIKEPSHRVRDDERGRESSKERDGERLKEEKHHRRREEEFVENRLQKRKEIDREERREKDEKRRRREEEGGFNLFHEKEDRGEKRKRDSMEEVIARESLHKNKRHDSHSVFSSGLDDILSISNNGSSMHIAESSLSLEKHTTSNGIQKGGFSVGITSLTGKADNIQDGVAQAGETSGLEGKMVQPLKGQSLSATDVLEKAKRALLVQKQLNEKLKKLPQVGKPTTQSAPTISLSSTIAVTSPSSTVPLPSVSATTLGEKQAPSPSTSNQTVQAGLRGPGFSFMPGLIPSLPGIPAVSTASSLEAIKKVQEFAARLGLQQGPSSVPLLGVVPGQHDDGTKAGQLKTVKAPVLRLDAQGREIDEHGNLVDRPKLTSLSTLKVNIKQQKREAFQILRPEIDEDPSSNPFYDPRMSLDNKKLMRPKRSTFQFVEEGRWSKQAEMLRLKSQFGEAQAKEIKAKQAALAKAKAEADINPNLIEVSERIPTKEEKVKDPIPEVEWWDVVLLPSGGYKDVTNSELKVKMEKLTIYVEHPVPIEPPAELPPPPPQPLKLTKKEQKKLRTQRRLAKEKDRQEMIRQGLIEPPKPKVKMSNLMKVLGAEATQDPTKLEMEIRTAAAEREQAHTDRNLARKLTPAERREKKEKKLFDDANTLETIVSVYRVDDLSHPQTRFKVDINAQENRLTGCVVICDKMCAVVVEGGSKSIKRYGKLMLRRINWAAAVKDEEGDGGEVQQVNKCALVWQGSVAKPNFDKFLIQQCRTEAAARKYLADAGVGHYWDLAADYSEE